MTLRSRWNAGRDVILPIAFATTAFACGSANIREPAVPPEPRLAADPTPGVRTYVAPLTPMNEQLRGRQVTGLAAFSVDDGAGTVRTMVIANNLSDEVETKVVLHGETTDAACPTIDADENADDIVDTTEALPYAGADVLPLAPEGADVEHIEDPEFRRGVVIVYGLGADPEDDALDRSVRSQPRASVPIACGEVTRIN